MVPVCTACCGFIHIKLLRDKAGKVLDMESYTWYYP